MKILELKDITHFYNGKKVLSIPSLSIEKSQIYGLVGPNGSGKTTLLSIMNLLVKPTTGIINFNHQSTSADNNTSMIHLRRSMTMVSQDPYLFNTSVGKNISYGLRARKIAKKEIKEKVKWALNIVGLEGFEQRGARELSGGEIKLVALARAIVLDPIILFLDEPCANVDSHHTKQFEELIFQINKTQGTTIILTTHNLSHAYQLTERVYSLFQGYLITSPIHNLFSGEIKKTKEGALFQSGKFSIWVAPQEGHISPNTHITIDPEDIILSLSPFSSSARNRFQGYITQIINQGGKIFLDVQVSKENFRILITKNSLQEMKLNVGSMVYLTFKASSVHIL